MQAPIHQNSSLSTDSSHLVQHPGIYRPWSQWSEDQRLHIVGVYNNPFRWRKRRELFDDWRRHMMSTIAWNFGRQDQFKAIRADRLQRRAREKEYGFAVPNDDKFPFGLAPGATGGAWAWRRHAFNTVGGMLDTCILGSGDWHMAFALIGRYGFDVQTERGRNTAGHTRSV